MTADDLISMHKAAERVIEDVSLIDHNGTDPMKVHDAIGALKLSVTTLATIQRDLLKAMLGA